MGSSRLVEAVGNTFQRIHDVKFDRSRVGAYRRVHIYDDPVSLTDASASRLNALLSGGFPEIAWVLMCGTLFQRPLYVGKTVNFQKRIKDHFDQKTKFSRTLRSHGISTNDCSVALCVLSTEGIEEEIDEPAEDEVLTEFDDGPPEDVSPDDDDEEELVPPGREDINRLVQLAESLVIRTSHPLFNEKMD